MADDRAGGKARRDAVRPQRLAEVDASRRRRSHPRQRTQEHRCSRGGFDVAFEVSGVRGVLATLFAALRCEATVITIGHPGEPVPIDVAAYITKRGITLRGIFGRRFWDTWEQLVLLVESGRLDLSWLITHRLPLTEADAAIELLSGEANKVLLVPSLS